MAFSTALQKLPPRLQAGNPLRLPAEAAVIARLLQAFQRCPLYAQHKIVALATGCGCGEWLEELIGPLPAPDEPPARRTPKKPMF